MYCRHCGKWLPDEAKFCTACGNRIDHVEQSGTQENSVQKPERQEKAARSAKKPVLIIVLIILAAATVIAAVGILLYTGRKADSSSEKEKEEIINDSGSGEKEEKKTDFDSQETVSNASFLFYDTDDAKSCIVDSYGRVITFDNYYPDFESVGDNGVLAGEAYSNGQKQELFIIKDGEKIVVDEIEGDSGQLDYELSGSGEKLIYCIPGKGVYSYDTDSGSVKVLDEGEEMPDYGVIRGVSYHGSVVLFGNSYISIERIQDGKPFWGATFARYLAASDDAGHVFYNASYQTTSGSGENEDVRKSVDFLETVVPRNYDPDSNTFPTSNTIMTSESIYAGILAHTSDYSEILFGYDGDTYYYKDQEKTRLTTGGIMVPAECFRAFSMHLNNSWYDSLVYFWHSIDPDMQESIDGDSVIHDDGSFYDIVHSMKSLKNQVYLRFNDSSPRTVSLVWLDEELQTEELIGNITSPVSLSKDGTKIWCIAGNEVCCVDLSSGAPEVQSVTPGGELIYHWELQYPMPIVTDDKGENVFYISDFRLTDPDESDTVSHGDLYRMSLDKMDSPAVIDSGVILMQYGEGDLVYYLKDFDPETLTGTLYQYNNQDDSKEQIAKNVQDFYVLDGTLFFLVREEESGTSSLRRKYSEGDSELVTNNVDYIEKQITG